MKYFSLVVATAASVLVGATPKSPDQIVTCGSPVRKGESAASLKARFGTEAKIREYPAPLGRTITTLVLWPDTPSKRMAVIFDQADTEMRSATAVWILDWKSVWKVGGIGMGSTVADVERANRRPVNVQGIGWNRGTAVEMRDGALAQLPGGCRVALAVDFGPEANFPIYEKDANGLRALSSQAKARVGEAQVEFIAVTWPTTRQK